MDDQAPNREPQFTVRKLKGNLIILFFFFVKHYLIIIIILLRIIMHITHVSDGMKGAGPIRLNPIIKRTDPIKVTHFGIILPSHSQPQHGAVRAYVPPFMTNMSPKIIGDKLNYNKNVGK
jgi:hypothetical protein